MIRIFADSTSSIPEALRASEGIQLLNLHVHHKGVDHKEGAMDLDGFYRDIYDMIDNPPTSSQPSPAETVQAFEEAAEAGDQVIVSCISSLMSGTFESTLQAAKQVAAKHPHFKFAVIDSTSNCMELGWPVVAAAQARNAGATMAECVSTIRNALDCTRFVFSPESLKFLEAGGRIGKASALLGSLVKINPVLTVKDGVASTLAKVRTHVKALDKIVEVFKSDVEQCGLAQVAVHYIGSKEPAAKWAHDVVEPLVGHPVPVIAASPVIGVHVGPAMGLAYQCQRPLPGKYTAVHPEVVTNL